MILFLGYHRVAYKKCPCVSGFMWCRRAFCLDYTVCISLGQLTNWELTKISSESSVLFFGLIFFFEKIRDFFYFSKFCVKKCERFRFYFFLN